MSSAAGQLWKWQAANTKEAKSERMSQPRRFSLLCESILDLVPPMTMAVRKWWIKLQLCGGAAQHVLLMLAATPSVCWLTDGDITPVCQLMAQGGESCVGKISFYSPQHLKWQLSEKSDKLKA